MIRSYVNDNEYEAMLGDERRSESEAGGAGGGNVGTRRSGCLVKVH